MDYSPSEWWSSSGIKGVSLTGTAMCDLHLHHLLQPFRLEQPLCLRIEHVGNPKVLHETPWELRHVETAFGKMVPYCSLSVIGNNQGKTDRIHVWVGLSSPRCTGLLDSCKYVASESLVWGWLSEHSVHGFAWCFAMQMCMAGDPCIMIQDVFKWDADQLAALFWPSDTVSMKEDNRFLPLISTC